MFLPRKFLGWLFLPLVLLGACGGEPSKGSRAAAPPASMAPRVVAGTGDPDPAHVRRVQEVADEEFARLLPTFPGLQPRPCFVHLHRTRDEMPEPLRAILHEDSPGFTLLGRRQIHVVWGEMRRTGASLRGVVAHELVHDLLDQFVAPHGDRMPRWFHEGLAQFLAGDTYLGAREQDLVWRVTAGSLLSFGELRHEFPHATEAIRIAYAQSHSYVSWLIREYGLADLLAIAKATDELTSFERALVGRLGPSTLQLEDAWRAHLIYGSGASWRVLLEQSFSFLLIAALPVLVLALRRRLAADARARARLRDAGPVAMAPSPVPMFRVVRGPDRGPDASPDESDGESDGDDLAPEATTHQCPVCDFDGLEDPPRWPGTGDPSFETCPRCGFQFGVTDDRDGIDYEQWRAAWRAGGPMGG